ncbi:cytochrome c/c1 heme-lyase [Naematelia encephala]|uniref:Holocytochrome c-type synthase n=1 Tax=Naematelia encephala TaxID=71784 RepID=A0A1Y2BCR7_9TREE|nr:cytochrome c/c1 heme-lyase [Naematelia encephala]
MVSFNVASSSSSSSTPSRLPAGHPFIPGSSSADVCPVDDSTRSRWLEAASQTPHPFTTSTSSSSSSHSRARLSDDREISSIPRTVNSPSPTPGSSEGISPTSTSDKWVYPSEQQFFNAMLRKNHNPQQGDMKTIVPIHNAVNEKAWSELLLWEEDMGGEKCGGPKLGSFQGRPKDRSPKAWIKTALGYKPPFDRHDWIVDRCGKQIRYVIDFYEGRKDPENPQRMGFYLDVRPALDTWDGIETRVLGWWSGRVGGW